MIPDLVSGAVAAGVSFLGTWAARRWALRSGRLDVPTDRSSHFTPMPRMGGLGILIGLLAGTFLIGLERGYETNGPVIYGAILFFLVGFLDDAGRGRGGLPPATKLLLQVAAGTIAVLLSLRFEGDASGPWGEIDLGWASPAMTVLWFVAVVNVINFMDGIDGITAATSMVLLSVAALAPADPGRPTLYLVAIAAVLGFAVWNAPRAKTFLGDGGSYLVGFLVASAPCGFGFGDSFAGSSGIPWALAAAPLVPSIVDVGMELIHKVRHGIPMSQPNNDHLYQRLTKAGWSHFAVAIRYGTLAAVAAVLAGPVADRFGLAAALVPGAAILGLHLWTGARTTRNVPRLGVAPR